MGSEEENIINELSARDTSLLDADNVPNANQSLTCFSCEEPMSGLYCYACGNKNDNYRRSVWSLGSELFQSLTAFEGRMWKSLFSLIFKPGQMARDYADGARQKWTSPIRLFLATSLVLFGYIALSGTQIIVIGDIKSGNNRSKQGINLDVDQDNYKQGLLFFVRESTLKAPPDDALSFMRDTFNLNIDQNRSPESLRKAVDDLTVQIEDVESEIAKDALTATRQGFIQNLAEIEAQTVTAPPATNQGRDEALDTRNGPQTDGPAEGDGLADGDGVPESSDSMVITGINGNAITLDGQGLSELYARVLRNPSVINNQLNTQLKWAMFFMMPFAMFIGATFIRGRETAMLYDHLVHAAYVHSFSFLLLFIFILLAQFTNISWLLAWYSAILLIYLPVSAKRAFRRGWFKSFLTAYGVGSVYTWMILFIATAIVVSALQTVAIDISDDNAVRTIQQTTGPGA